MVHRARQGLRVGRRGARSRRSPHRAAKLISRFRLLARYALTLASSVAVGIGCKSEPPPPQRPLIATFTVPNAPAKVVKVLYEGRPIPLIDDLHWKLTLPHGTDLTSLAPKFQIVVPTTCGEENVEVAAISPEGQLTGKWPAVSVVYIDRDAVGSGAIVAAGGHVVEGKTEKVLPGKCEGARTLRVDDTVVGELGTSTIVDAKGGHCYEVLTNGFPSARLEGKRSYERPLDLFLPAEIPPDKIALRRCEGKGGLAGHGSASFADLMGASNAPAPHGPVGAFTANPHSKSNKPPPPPPPPKKPPRKPRK